jgi:hypothetical protein
MCAVCEGFLNPGPIELLGLRWQPQTEDMKERSKAEKDEDDHDDDDEDYEEQMDSAHTAFFAAVREGRIDLVKSILLTDTSVSVNYQNPGKSVKTLSLKTLSTQDMNFSVFPFSVNILYVADVLINCRERSVRFKHCCQGWKYGAG